MSKQDFRIRGGGLKIDVLQTLDSLSELQYSTVGLSEFAKHGRMNDLVDVDVSNVSTKQIMRWNAAQGKFISDVDSDTLLSGLTNSSNTALGASAFTTGGGIDNVAIGHNALSQSTGSGNIAIGDDAGSALVSGDNNVIIGRNDGSSIAGLSNQLIVSDGAGTIIMSGDAAQKVSTTGAVDVTGVMAFGSTTETTDKINEGSINRYFTDARVKSVFDAMSTDSLSEGVSNKYWTEGRFNSSFLAKTTDSLAEGDDLYYTRARFDAAFTDTSTDSLSEGVSNLYYTEDRFNTSFLAKTTDSLAEGSTNLYYTRARFDSAFGASSTDALEEGAVNFYWTEGRFNTSFDAKTTANLTEDAGFKYFTDARVKSVFDVTTTDSISEGLTNKYFTDARVKSVFDVTTTDSISQGVSNLYWTEGRFNTSFGAKTTDSLTEGSNLYFTNARAIEAAKDAYSGGTGVTYDRDTIGVSIGQAVETTSAVQFAKTAIDSILAVDTATTTTTDTAEVSVGSFAKTEYQSATMSVTITEGTKYHTTEIMVVHDGSEAYMVSFGTLETAGDLASFSVDVDGDNVRLLATPASASSTVFKVVRHGIGTIAVSVPSASEGGGGGDAGGDAAGESAVVGSGDTLLFIGATP